MGKCKRKMADGGMVAAGQKQWQERLAEMWATKPKPAAYADGGAVETPEQVMARMAKKYGVPATTPQQPAAQPAQQPQPQQPPQDRGLSSLPGTIQRRADELKKATDYDKPRGMAIGGIAGVGAIESSPLQPEMAVGEPIGGPRYDTPGGPQVWSDGTRRDGLTAEEGRRFDSQQRMQAAQAMDSPVAAPTDAPLRTMAEQQVAAGINPNAMYRPGGPGDPHASGGMAMPKAASPISESPQQPAAVNPSSLLAPTQRRPKYGAFADGGMVQFAGKGGPRDDQIPVKVAGEQIRVSDGESAVILPAKTAANMTAVQAIGSIIRLTNDGRAPDMGMADDADSDGMACGGMAGKRKMARGGVAGTEEEKRQQTAPTAQEVYRDVSPSGMVSAVTPKVGLSDHPIYGGVSASGMVDALRNWNSTATPAPAVAEKQAVAAPPVAAMTAAASRAPAAPVAQAPVAKQGGALSWLPEGGMLRPENRQRFNAISENGMAGPIFGGGAPAASVQAVASQAKKPAVQQATYSNDGRGMAMQAINSVAQTPDPRIAATTGNSGARVMPSGAVEVNMGKGFDPTKLSVAPGSGYITDPKTGRTMILNNMDPNQYVGADGTPGQRWEKTQAYIDAQNRLQADKLRVAEMQAVRQGMSPVQAAAATQGMAQAAQRAPLDRQVVQQQIETGKVAAQNSRELQDLYAAHKSAATADEQERIAEQIRIRIGKDKPEEFAHAAGGTTINPSTMGVEKTPDVIYSKRTGKTPGATPAAAKTFSKSDVDAAISAGASKEAVAARIKSMGMNPKDYGL